MSFLEVKNLTFAYPNGDTALDNISMSFHKGKTTAILGGNGAGKSSLFLNLNGVLKPQSGEILFCDKPYEYDKKGLINVRSNIGIVFQNPEDQLFSASVYKDISYGPHKLGLSEIVIKERVEWAIKHTNVSLFLNKPTHELSFGQKKRVAIAGVLAMHPKVIILDEPTAGLDPEGVSELLALLTEIKDNMGISVLISTHDIDMVPLYCDDVFVLDKGKVVFSGTPKELFSNPTAVRTHSLRLPRINHLMNILKEKDGLDVDVLASTISQARKSIKALFCARYNCENISSQSTNNINTNNQNILSCISKDNNNGKNDDNTNVNNDDKNHLQNDDKNYLHNDESIGKNNDGSDNDNNNNNNNKNNDGSDNGNNQYVVKSGKKLKCGITTGSCATGATKACAMAILTGEKPNKISIVTANETKLSLDVEFKSIGDGFASCSVIKDAGDDPDVTDGIEIISSVQKIPHGFEIDGGEGIGRVTRMGLSFNVGEAAINPGPRKMIAKALMEVSEKYGYEGGFKVIISATNGEEVAKKTFNSRLGIVGGISILGTTGIVEPMSEKAIIETIMLEIDSKIVSGSEILCLTPGNYGLEFMKNNFDFDIDQAVKCSNYIGEAIDYALFKGVKKILLIGHCGKLSKLAAGIFNTHSKMADGRSEIFATHAALSGAGMETVKEIMSAITTQEIDSILIRENIEMKVYQSILDKILFHLNHRAGNKIEFQVLIFLTENGERMKTDGVKEFILQLKNKMSDTKHTNYIDSPI